jgi:integrase/recombinase XerD
VISNMPRRYVHFKGGESMDDLVKVKGIVKDDKRSINILKPKQCPNCSEPNRPDAQVCYRCSFVMSFEAYQKGMEKSEKKDLEIQELKEQIKEIRYMYENLVKRNTVVRNMTHDGRITSITDGWGRPL